MLLQRKSASSWGCELKCVHCSRERLAIRSASSWGCELKFQTGKILPKCHCQPLREAVSWNFDRSHNAQNVTCQPLREAVSWNNTIPNSSLIASTSASSWGCELKYRVICPFWHGCFVSLFVRLWVEMWIYLPFSQTIKSASSWGCELKWNQSSQCQWMHRQPLREAVSWNTCSSYNLDIASLSASSWGCELK